jgi:hypothetical protein
MKANVPENVAHEELMAMPSNPRALAICLLRFNKAVHATILELDDLFDAIIAPAPEPLRVSYAERCDSCTPRVKCCLHLGAAEIKSVTREIWAAPENVAVSQPY